MRTERPTFGTSAGEDQRRHPTLWSEEPAEDKTWSGRFCDRCFLELPFDTSHCSNCDD